MKKILALTFLVVLFLGLAGCAQRESKVIGAIMPLSGSGAFMGQQFQKGMFIATEEINAQGDKLEIIYEDSKGDPKEGVSAYQKLSTTVKPDIFLSAFSGVSLALIPIIEQDKMPLFMSIVSGSKYAQKSKYAVRYFSNVDLEAPVISDYAVNKMNLKKISVLYIKDAYGTDSYTTFKEKVELYGGSIVASETFLMPDYDFKTQLLKLKDSGSEAMYVIGYDNHIIAILKQIKELGINQVIMSNAIMASKTNIASAGPAAEGVIISTPGYYLYDSPEKLAFEKKFSERYTTKPDAYGALGYDTVYIINDALKKGNTKEEILKALLETRKQTMMGNVVCDESGEMNFPLYPAIIENGMLKPLQ